jgi:hypothetical protein
MIGTAGSAPRAAAPADARAADPGRTEVVGTAPGRALLDAADWRSRAEAHGARADDLTAGHRDRRARGGERHAIEDFLFEYYPAKPAQLRRWHPGAGVALADAAEAPQAGWRWYRADADGTVGLPLRLGGAGTDEVVERHRIRCTHIDAFRFFTPDAVPRNTLRPTRETQVAMEQPGCLHANMDLYKWALKLGPAVPGDLLLDAFALAREIRTVDMQASPYDVSSYGLAPIAIETPEGKAEYVRRQRGFAAASQALRARLLAVCDAVLGEACGDGASGGR